MPVERIVVGTDFSDHANLAVKQAMAVARHAGAHLTLIHACAATEAQLAAVRHWTGNPQTLRHLARHAISHAHDQLERQYDQLTGQGVELSQLLIDAPAAQGICDAAEELGADLVVVGAGAERPLFGGVAEKVVRGFAGDVLVARGTVGMGGFRHILVPIDFHPRAFRAIELARELAAPDARIEILHSWFQPVLMAGTFGQGGAQPAPFTDSMFTTAQVHCETIAARYRTPHVKVSAATIVGPPRSAILDHAREGGFDLIAIGSHGRHGVVRFVLGSVAEAIVRHADRSVLVTHGAGSTDGDLP